jgi:hypothetical protein
MTWPFAQGGGLLALYLATLALHAVFIGYVVAGTAFALIRRDDPIAVTVRDRLPFMLGAGITAGVAPLLFVQLLYQHRFYTANLLLGPRWLAVVPVLIVGFYALYIQKVSEKWRRAALISALGCFVFVGWSWSELHELMKADPAWHDFYAAGKRVYFSGSIAPRSAVLFPAMATSFAMMAAWSTDAAGRQRLALLAIGSRLVSIGGAVWLWKAGFSVDGPAFSSQLSASVWPQWSPRGDGRAMGRSPLRRQRGPARSWPRRSCAKRRAFRCSSLHAKLPIRPAVRSCLRRPW